MAGKLSHFFPLFPFLSFFFLSLPQKKKKNLVSVAIIEGMMLKNLPQVFGPDSANEGVETADCGGKREGGG